MNTYLSIPISPENREIELDHMIYSLIFIPVFIHVSPGGRPPAPRGWGWMCTGVWWINIMLLQLNIILILYHHILMIYNLSVHVSPGGRPPAPPAWGWMCTGVWWTAPAPPSSSPWAGHCSRVRYDNTISGVIILYPV